MGKKQTHLRIIRTIRRRMSSAPLVLRLWCVPLVGALLALTREPAHARYGWLAVALTIAFWLLDTQFLRQAALLEKTYDRVQATPEAEIDLVLDTRRVDGDDASFRTLMFSRAPFAFYGALLGTIAVVRSVLHVG